MESVSPTPASEAVLIVRGLVDSGSIGSTEQSNLRLGRLVPATSGDSSKKTRTADELMRELWQGYALATPRQFLEAIETGAFEIWELEPGAHALIEFVDTSYGKTLNVLTTVGDSSHFETGLLALERIAKDNGAAAIYSVGHMGWLPLMRRHGYHTERKLMMIKVL